MKLLPLRPLRSLREAFRRRPDVQVDLAYATTEDLLTELRSRSRAIVVIICPLIHPDRISYLAGGDGDDGEGPRKAELLGLISFAHNEISGSMRGAR